jgi:DNA-directed RNA polymerase subunit M/transcription elongation factor TFIIS
MFISYGSEDTGLKSDKDLLLEEVNISNWIDFNLDCIKKHLAIELSPREFCNHKGVSVSNDFFDTVLYSSFRKPLSKVDVEEGLEKCPICSGFKILSEQIQKRSADEGMTNVHKCSECNWTWEN